MWTLRGENLAPSPSMGQAGIRHGEDIQLTALIEIDYDGLTPLLRDFPGGAGAAVWQRSQDES